MDIFYDSAMWLNTVVESMGLWATAPFILGAALVGLKMGHSRNRSAGQPDHAARADMTAA